MKRRHLALILLLITLVASLIGALGARPISVPIAQRWGSGIVHAGDGKFSDAAIFLQHRMVEGAWLLISATGFTAATIGLGALMARRVPPLWKWVAYSATGFLAANIWIKFAVRTCLFWCLFWNGKGTTDNLTQFHIKLLLMDESPAPIKVVLAGSSQVRTQIDPRLLNGQFGSNIFTTELHFPGNHSFDFLFLNRKLESHKADVIFCYLSEGNFFLGALSDGFPLFFSFRDLAEFFRLGGKPQWSSGSLGYGLLGDVLPLFWLRDPLVERVFGEPLTGLRQRQQDSSLGPDLHRRAVVAAKAYHRDSQSDFSFAAFEAFVAECRAQHRTVMVCCGQVNPILARELDPALRPYMVNFLRALSAKYENVVLLDEHDWPVQTEADYDDLAHATPAARIRFTEALAVKLQSLPGHSKNQEAATPELVPPRPQEP